MYPFLYRLRNSSLLMELEARKAAATQWDSTLIYPPDFLPLLVWKCVTSIDNYISICLIIDGGENMEWDLLADCFKALGDKTRLRILALLKVEELCVCELVDILGMTQPAVSQHMRRLKQAKLVKERRQGQWVFYSLDGSIYPFFDDVVRMLPDLREEVEKLKQRGRRVVCR